MEVFKELIGKKIVEVRHMSREEADTWGWYYRPVIISFEDGTTLVPTRDDEQNDGGAMIYLAGNDGDEFFTEHLLYTER
jgi:hypothetical protein